MNESVRKLEEASEKFDVLKASYEILGPRGALEAAAALRHNVTNDTEIIEACNASPEDSENRKKFLDDITHWINDLISVCTKMPQEIDLSYADVANFSDAKKAMVEMIEDEQAKHLFQETESPKLLDDMAECKKHAATICNVEEHCKNGSFLALILGEYQSGKSTTIDAFCDGRHISAIGKGTATSAVLVMVSYGKEESFKINWRAKEQFLPIFDRIKRVLPDYDWVSFDLENKVERIKLANAIEQKRKQENQPKDQVETCLPRKTRRQNLQLEDVKFLMLSDLILNFYDTDNLREKKSSLLTTSNVYDITRFPKDGETKWEKEGVKNFTIDESIFVFIDSVSCTTPSETLKKLNCTIIDSPGLFNSDYDTMVADSAMVAAHAIIYVLPYHKGIGEDVRGSLENIKNKYPDLLKKLFIVNNVNSAGNFEFVESNRADIKSMFGPEKEVYAYDAKMSYLAQLKRRYDKGLATNADFAHLMHAKSRTPLGKEIELKFNTFDKAWYHWISPYEKIYGKCDASTIDAYLTESGFDDMCAELKAFVERNEAYAVILSNGLIPMRRELRLITEDLCKRYVEPYTKSHDELSKLWDQRIARAEDFQKFALETVHTELFEAVNGKPLLESISEEEYKKLFSSNFYSEIAKAVAEVLYDNKSTFLASQAMMAIRHDVTIQTFPPRIKFKDNGRFQTVFTDLATPLIRAKLTEIVTNKIRYLLGTIESGQDQTVANLFTPVVDKISLLCKRKWDSLFKGDKGFDMDSYFTLPKDLKGYAFEKRAAATGTDLTSDLTIGATLLGGIIMQVSAVVAGIAAMIAGYIGLILCDPTFTALIVCVLLGIGGIVILIAGDYVRETFVEFLKVKIEPKITTDASSSFRQITDEQMKTILERYADGRVVDIQKMKNQRDIALTPNPDQGGNCFKAIEIISKIKHQLAVYYNYLKNNLKNESN